MKKNCAWISRHEPTPEQRRNLIDYRIFQINPPGRLWSASDAILLSHTACEGPPDLYVVVMPYPMLKHFVEKVDGRVPILRSAVKLDKKPSWAPPWEQIVSVNIITQPWVPARKDRP